MGARCRERCLGGEGRGEKRETHVRKGCAQLVSGVSTASELPVGVILGERTNVRLGG